VYVMLLSDLYRGAHRRGLAARRPAAGPHRSDPGRRLAPHASRRAPGPPQDRGHRGRAQGRGSHRAGAAGGRRNPAPRCGQDLRSDGSGTGPRGVREGRDRGLAPDLPHNAV